MVGKFFSEISKNAQTLTHKIHVRSALNPILWLTLITTPLCWGFAYLYPAFQSLLIYAGLFPPGVAIIGFFYFMLCDSPKLQSEDYQIKHEALQMMQAGDKWKLIVPPELGYGAAGVGPIPGNTTLIFEVELIKIGQ